jgi:hypothetical protein
VRTVLPLHLRFQRADRVCRELSPGGELSGHPPFHAFVYSLENSLPVVDLHKAEYWRPNPLHGS